VGRPLSGKEALRTQWWQPLEPALENVQITVLDHYINDSMTAIITEAEIKIVAVNPPFVQAGDIVKGGRRLARWRRPELGFIEAIWPNKGSRKN
jgi:hypothetical protein